MTKLYGSILLVLAICCPAFAIRYLNFEDADTYIRFSKDIVIAECISRSRNIDGAQVFEVNVIKILKGDKKPGYTQITTIHYMKPDFRYLLSNTDGNVNGDDFKSFSQLSVVPLPTWFNEEDLKDKNLKEQVQYIFSRRLFEVERELRPLLEEKKFLEIAVSDRSEGLYDSNRPVKIEPIIKRNTHTNNTGFTWFDLDSKKIMWSSSKPGTSGVFYFGSEGIFGIPHSPYWEFAPCEAKKIEDITGKSLKTRFYGLYSPGRSGWTGGHEAFDVNVGQVMLVRAIDEPNKVYIIQIVSQKENKEQMTARYAVIAQ